MVEILTDSNVNLDEVDVKKTWDTALDILKKDIAPSTFEPWITPLVPACKKDVQYKNDVFVLKSHQAFGVTHLNQKFLPDIEEAVREALKKNVKVEIVFAPEDIKKVQKKKDKEQEIALREAQLENLKQMQSFSSLNLKYTFENFVEGENSKVAYNAAKMIAQNPGAKFNPFFITGSVGIGKTHLMHAIGHSILKNFPKLKVKYAKTEDFTNQLVDCCRGGDSYGSMKKFRDKYRNIDVLLLDDIQFAEGKKRTEEEIFNTFDTLFKDGKQIVFASDRPIEDFSQTSERLTSRYKCGLSVEIQPPAVDVRIKIIKEYSKSAKFEITDEVAEFLAENFSKNVRELQGAYNKVSAYAQIQGHELTVDFAKDVLGLNGNKKTITPDFIMEKTAECLGIDKDAIKGKDRAKEVAAARQIAIYLVKEILDLSYPSIAKTFDRTHSTVIYACERTKKNVQFDLKLQNDITNIKNHIFEA